MHNFYVMDCNTQNIDLLEIDLYMKYLCPYSIDQTFFLRFMNQPYVVLN